jgi:hypothetical protein
MPASAPYLSALPIELLDTEVRRVELSAEYFMTKRSRPGKLRGRGGGIKKLRFRLCLRPGDVYKRS